MLKPRKFDSITVTTLDNFVRKLDLIIKTSKNIDEDTDVDGNTAKQKSFCLYNKNLSDHIKRKLPFVDLIKHKIHNLPDNNHIIKIVKDDMDNPTGWYCNICESNFQTKEH